MLLLSQVWLLVPAVDENEDAHPVEDENNFEQHFILRPQSSTLDEAKYGDIVLAAAEIDFHCG